jgi:hypothetical protein
METDRMQGPEGRGLHQRMASGIRRTTMTSHGSSINKPHRASTASARVTNSRSHRNSEALRHKEHQLEGTVGFSSMCFFSFQKPKIQFV